MKKFTTLLTMAFIALMSISFTSCDDDSDIAYTLDGTEGTEKGACFWKNK